MFKSKNIKRIELVKILDEFHKEINGVEPGDIPNNIYIKYLNLLKEKLLSKNYISDNRFVTYCRRDFLKQEMLDRLNQKVFTGINYKLEAFYDLEDYIKNDTWISLASIPTSENADKIIKDNDSYKNDGKICEEEKNILIEMINEFLDFCKTKVFEISHYNFGLMGPNDWNHTIWEIYEDCSIVKKEYYNGEMGNLEEPIEKKYSMIISTCEFNEIKKHFEFAEFIDEKVEACDGDAWGFSYYKNNNVTWTRNVSYIYGIRELEIISEMIDKLDVKYGLILENEKHILRFSSVIVNEKISIDFKRACDILREICQICNITEISNVKNTNDSVGETIEVTDGMGKKYYVGISCYGFIEIIREHSLDGKIIFVPIDD